MRSAATAGPLWLDPDFPALKNHVIESTGLAYYADKDDDLAARIGPRLSQLAMDGCGDYLALLKNRESGESERHLLINQLTIGETYFFRFTEQFDALRDVVIPDLLERNQATRTLRIWSAGCAIGAEPYSIAILLTQHFAERLEDWNVQIIGTDINQSFLARASQGVFDDRALRSTADDVKGEWFVRSGRSWAISPRVKDMVSFQYHNLVEHPYPSIVHGISAMDLILCRNVLIYFDWDVIQRIINRFGDCLVDNGWLAVGHAESNPEVFRSYRTVNVPGATLYQKHGERPVPDVRLPPLPVVQPSWSPASLPPIPDVPTTRPVSEPPDNTLVGLGSIRRLADQGKWLEAASACDAMRETDSLNPSVHFYQGLIQEQMRQSSNAESAFRRAIYLNRAFVLAHYHLALLLAKAGNRDAAILSLRNVQTLLDRLKRDAPIADGDGLTAEDLTQLAGMHLELLRS